jgi:hypothetical protein
MSTKSKSNATGRPAPAAEPAPAAVQAPSGGEAAAEAAAEPQTLSADLDAVAAALAAPFDAAEVKFKPQTISGNRALAVPFVDARVVQDRLDDVLGVWGWEDRYFPQADGSVLCTLTVRAGDRVVTKSDVGGQSEQPDEGDRCKAAVSDALKRAAVKFGVGRYLYRQKPQWVDYDPAKRQFTRQPVLTNAPAAAAKPTPQPAARQAPPPAAEADPAAELKAKDAALAHEGLCEPGALLAAVKAAVNGRPWTQSYKAAREAAAAFERELLLAELDALLDAKGEDAGRVLAKLKAKAGTSFTMLDGAQLRQAIGWLRPLEDAPAKQQGGRKSA